MHHRRNGRLTRIDFGEPHRDSGKVYLYGADGYLASVRFAEPHRHSGAVMSYEGGELVHVRHANGRVCSFLDGGRRMRVELQEGVEYHYEGGVRTHIAWVGSHPDSGKTCSYGNDGKLTRADFTRPHRNSGMVMLYNDGLHVRTEYAEWDFNHSEILHFRDGKLVKTTRRAGGVHGAPFSSSTPTPPPSKKQKEKTRK